MQLSRDRAESMACYASANVSYYSKSRGVPLSAFPVVDKNIIRGQRSAFLSGLYRKSNLTEMVTSGSTGTPFAVLQDKGKRLRNAADTIWWGQHAGYAIGTPLFYFRIWTSINRKSSLSTWLENIIPVDVMDLSSENLSKIAGNLLSKEEPFSLLGYASALESVGKYMKETGGKCTKGSCRAIIAISEALESETKTLLESQFGACAVSRYSNIENGIIAQQSTSGTSHFLVNWASYWVEILDLENDVPVADGTLGRIVVTDLHNKGMPFVRYDTGDTGSMLVDDYTGQRVMTKIEGRRMDAVYDTRGRPISPFTINNQMCRYPEVAQYQFIQEDEKSYKFKINTQSGLLFLKEAQLIAEYKAYLGQDAKISIEYVSGIPLLKSGKRKKVVNMMTARTQ